MPATRLRSTALLVIDVQESFRRRDYFDDRELPAFFERCTTLLDGFTTAGLPIVRILHVEPDGPFSKASGFVAPMPELRYRPAATFEKHVHSAMVGTGLHAWLTARGIARLVVAGIRTEQCCETTTRHASDLGFELDYVTEATLTFPMRTRAGRPVSTDDRAQDAIVADPTRDWNLASIAEASHASVRHLSRLFRDETGTTVLAYLQTIRLALAREHLGTTGWSVERVAEAAGFSSAHQLRRVWQRGSVDHHASPREARAQVAAKPA